MTYRYAVEVNVFGEGFLLKELARPQEVVVDSTGRAKQYSQLTDIELPAGASLWIADLPRNLVPDVILEPWLMQRIQAENHAANEFHRQANQFLEDGKAANEAYNRCLANKQGYKAQLSKVQGNGKAE